MFFVFRKIEVISPIYLPYTNLTSDWGFLLNLSILMVLCIMGFLGFSTHDATFLLYGYQSVAYVEILKIKLSELSSMIEQNKLIKNDSKDLMIKNYLKEIIKLHQDYQDYRANMIDFASIPSFTSISLNVLAICFSIVCALKISFVPGIAGTVGFFIQIAIPCFVGHLITVQNEKFHEALYDLPWYEINDVRTWKIFLQFLKISQDSGSIALPMIGGLGMKLLGTVMNAIYSYSTVLLSFL